MLSIKIQNYSIHYCFSSSGSGKAALTETLLYLNSATRFFFRDQIRISFSAWNSITNFYVMFIFWAVSEPTIKARDCSLCGAVMD